MNNISLNTWTSPEGNQSLEVICDTEHRKNIRLYNFQETREIDDVVKDDESNYYVYRDLGDKVDLFTQDGHIIEIIHRGDVVSFGVHKAGHVDISFEVTPEQALTSDKITVHSEDGRKVEAFNPYTGFPHEKLVHFDPFNSNIIIREEKE